MSYDLIGEALLILQQELSSLRKQLTRQQKEFIKFTAPYQDQKLLNRMLGKLKLLLCFSKNPEDLRSEIFQYRLAIIDLRKGKPGKAIQLLEKLSDQFFMAEQNIISIMGVDGTKFELIITLISHLKQLSPKDQLIKPIAPELCELSSTQPFLFSKSLFLDKN